VLQTASLTLARTDPGHLGASSASSQFAEHKISHYEIRPRGTGVSHEDEMLKLAANQIDYDAVASLHTHSLALIKNGDRHRLKANLEATFHGLLAKSYLIPTEGPGLAALATTLAMDVAAALGIPLCLLCIAAFAGNSVKHRFVFSTDPVKP
jgi:hypothetical protein